LAIFVVYAFLLRGALESRESEMETHLEPDAAAPAAEPEGEAAPGAEPEGEEAAEPEGGGEEAAEGGEEAAEPGEGGAPDEPDSGGDAAAKPDEPAPGAAPAPACNFGKANDKVLTKALKGRAEIFEFYPKISCTSMNISEGDHCCKLLKRLGQSIREAKKKAKKTDDKGVSAWCNLDAQAKWAVERKGRGMEKTCDRHTDCAQAWWTKGMVCAKSSSLFSLRTKCRLCPRSVLRPSICKSLKDAEKKECERFETCKEDENCANPSVCEKSSANIKVNGRRVEKVCKGKTVTTSKKDKKEGETSKPGETDKKA